jgi:ABC-type branched-subunit amino acid transport system permease subunit
MLVIVMMFLISINNENEISFRKKQKGVFFQNHANIIRKRRYIYIILLFCFLVMIFNENPVELSCGRHVPFRAEHPEMRAGHARDENYLS